MVEKLKEAGLRYGDKAAVGVGSLLFVVCLGAALSKQSIQLTPEEVKSAAEAAEANLNRHQEREDIIKKLEGDGIKPTDFAKEAEDSANVVLVANNYKPDRQWVTPEPGAGLLRDTPKLIAATEVYAYPGRGGALVYDLDENGQRKPETETKEAPLPERRGRRRRRQNAGMGGMMGNMGRRRPRASRRSQADIEKEQKAEAELKQKQISASLAGRDEAPEAKDKDEEKKDTPAQNQQFKEITKGLRWVAITGVIDHAKLVANYRDALKSPSAAPHYARLQVERQVHQKDGTWSKWEKIDSDENYKILDNLPEEDEELTPDTVRPDNLNDPLPFLKAGLYEKVHIASLVPKEKKEVKPPPSMGGMGGMGGKMGGMGMMGSGAADMQRMMSTMASANQPQYGRMGMSGGGKMMGMGMGSMEMGGMGTMGGGGGDVGNYWKSEEKRVMIRALDFTAQPDNTYRYRVQIVVFNPNLKRDDVINKGVDTEHTELFGPWSDPTDEVSMPADVAAYAMGPVPAGPKSDAKVAFQVVRFDVKDGVTVPRLFMGGPGEVIGDVSSADIPTSEGTGKKSKPVDFNSHQIVLDTSGGAQALPTGFPGGALERPALALLLRNDGSVLARFQPDDLNNEVRKDIKKNYDREVAESSKKRETSMGSGYGAMMGSMMGGMMGGGGYPGMGGRR
jgi:hypothetical protein